MTGRGGSEKRGGFDRTLEISRLFVRPEEPGDFGAQQLDEGAWEHLFGLLRRVPEVVLRVGQHVKQSLYQLLILGRKHTDTWGHPAAPMI